MAKIAVVGPRENILYYLSAGFAVYAAEDAKSAKAELERAADDGASVIFISPAYADALADEMRKYAFGTDVAVTLLPQRTEGIDPGTALMKSAVERAVGADIVYKEN